MRFHFHIRTAEILSDKRQIVLGHGEISVDRIQALDRHQRWTGRSNQIPNINIAQTDSTVDRRFDKAIIEIHLCGFRSRLRFLRVRHSSIVILLRYDFSRAQVFLPFQRHLIQRSLRFRLVNSCLVGPRIDREKQIAFFHVGAILKMACHNHAAHLRLHLHGFVRCAGANLIQIKRHILCDDPGDTRRTHWRLSRFHVRSPVLENPVRNEPSQQDKKQIRPLRNSLIRTTDMFSLRPHRRLGYAVIQCLMVTHRRVSFHFAPLAKRPFF